MNVSVARRTIPLWIVFPAIFLAITAAHGPLLRLPYYWDEAGYYIPAAFDFFRTGALIPYSTLSNAHPPLPAIYLTLWWKLFGFSPLVTRIAMCFMASIALTAVWKIALLTTARNSVASFTVLLTALYPVFFAQSSLAHADLTAAAASLWAIAFLLRRTSSGIWLSAFCFSLAALSKETAIVTPLALALCELRKALGRSKENSVASTQAAGAPGLASETWDNSPRVPQVSRLRPGIPPREVPNTSRLRPGITAAILSLPVLPLVLWYLYHRHRTGFVFGNPEYLRYNAGATLDPLRILLALGHRILHITAHMNLFVPVLLMIACMLLPPLKESDGSGRERISFADQAIFYVVIAANILFFSILGGALLTRYLLPLYPLVILLCVNTFRRRFEWWPSLVALSAVAFVAGLFVNPPYRFAPEDNLAYANVIRLHQEGIAHIVDHYSHDTILTAWPATDELSKPELGYVSQPIKVAAIDNFSFGQIQKAKQEPEAYSVAFLFSTKYDPPHLLMSLGPKNEQLDRRFFDFHRDLEPQTVTRILDGDMVWRAQRKGQWAALIHLNRAAEAELQPVIQP